MFGYVWRELTRNRGRTLVAMLGATLGVGLFSGVLFFADGSAASLTQRALAPLTLDMQRVLTSPLGYPLTFEERHDASGPLAAGDDVRFTLAIANVGGAPVNELVVNDEPPAPLTYVHGTTTLNGAPVADVVGQSPLANGLARIGLNVGVLAPGATMTITYVARATRPVDDATTLRPRGTISTREDTLPRAANAPPPWPIERLATVIASVPGVAAADALYAVDLPRGSLRAGDATLDRPARLFAFAPAYAQHHPSIALVDGSFADGGAVLSAEATRALGATVGTTVTIALPGGAPPTTFPVSGTADLARAAPLFASRKSSTFEDFVYVPHSVVVSPATFERIVIPAFQGATATPGTVTRSAPVLEVDVQVDRTLLRADPARALEQTEAIAAAINAIAPGQDYLIDNISNALAVARADAATGRRMFTFLGLPGVLVAAFLAAYTGRILSSTQRREVANLRLRGAGPAHLRRIALHRTVLFAGGSAIAGTLLGFAGALAVLGADALLAASTTDLAISGATGVAIGALATGAAQYLPMRRWLRRDVGVERRELAVDPVPAWRRRHLDLALLGAAGIAEIVAFRTGALDAARTSVSAGESPSLPALTLLAPLAAWLGGTLVAARAVSWAVAHLRVGAPPAPGLPVRWLLARSVRRRPWPLATGIVGVCLVTAFGITLAVFAASYDATKVRDTRFVVGGDLRITPSPVGARELTTDDAGALRVAGVTQVTPVAYTRGGGVLFGEFEQDRADLAAIDPTTFAGVAPVAGSRLAALTAALATDRDGLLVRAELAERLGVATGDRVKVVLARGTEHQAVVELHVVGQFERFPGFASGVDLVVDLRRYADATQLRHIDVFLARTADADAATVRRATAALQAGPGLDDPLAVESTATALDKDRSSLTAFDLRGLLRLDLASTAVIAAVTVAMFVVSTMLQRRREHALLRAQGMSRRRLRALVLGEAALVAVSGSVAGVLVGIGAAHLFVDALRPLFVLEPPVTLPIARLTLLAGLPIGAAIVSSLVAEAAVARADPTELLREP